MRIVFALPRVGDFAAVLVPFTYCLKLFVSAFITIKSCFGFSCLHCRVLMLDYASLGACIWRMKSCLQGRRRMLFPVGRNGRFSREVYA